MLYISFELLSVLEGGNNFLQIVYMFEILMDVESVYEYR